MSKEPTNCTDSELCTYLQALAAGYLPTCCSDTFQCAPSKSITIAAKSWTNGKRTGAYHGFQFSMTCETLTAHDGADSSTSSLGAFPARTSVPQERERASTASGRDSGEKWQGSLAKYDHDSRSWKTRQCLLAGGLAEYAETWPRWGMTRNGGLYQQPTPSGLLAIRAYITSEKGCGSSLPTPRANERQQHNSQDAGMALSAFVKLPTPRSTDGSHGSRSVEGIYKEMERGRNIDLTMAVMQLPTPTVRDRKKDAKARQGGASLGVTIRSLATPTARDWKSGNASLTTMERNSRPLSEQVGGSLNPQWVEWLMGWPVGWTDLEPLETDRFQLWRRSHGKSLRAICDDSR